FGPMKGIGCTNIFKKHPSQIVASAPTFGEHNREFLESLGYSAAEIDEMYAKKEMVTMTAADTAVVKNLAAWGFFWDPKRQSERLGLEFKG
ncbi:MAG: hypothetical protein UEE32_03970, partial [Oscillospiraceae bacterium]|nr:hypothetical protein [Oscillospiraceae bacterium]